MESSYLRERARWSLTGKWGLAVLTTWIASLLGGLVINGGTRVEIDSETVAALPEELRQPVIVLLGVIAVLGIVQFIVGGAAQLGYSRFLLNLHDDRDARVSDLLSQFDRFGDGFCLVLLRGLYTFLWMLLFIVPGIMAAYGYAMASFVMVENPEMGVNEALRVSKKMMQGHKFELFCLELSFIGWDLLSLLTLGIGSLWLNPYKNAAYAAFYRSLTVQTATVE